MKTCFKCGVEKPLSEYYRHKQMADGYLNKCKECAKKDAMEHRAANIERYRQYEKERALLPHRRELSKRVSAEWVKANPDKAKEQRRRNPEKYAARTRLGNAVRNGIVAKQPCQVCGDPRSQGHHEDYSRPLDVMWLCPKHHAERHKQMKGA